MLYLCQLLKSGFCCLNFFDRYFVCFFNEPVKEYGAVVMKRVEHSDFLPPANP